MLNSMIEETTTKIVKCKGCGSTDIVRFGTYKGVQRYFCKSCKRKFKDDNAQFHEKKPSTYITRAVSEYYSGMSITEIRDSLKQEYGYHPSKSIVFKWVNKYTDLARKQFQDCHPQVGDTWIADETMLDIDKQHKVWFYDIIDRDTRFLLASRVALSRKTKEAQSLMEEAERRAGKKPKEVLTDQNFSYTGGIKKAYGSDTEHVIGNPFKEKDTGKSTSQIERFHGTLKDRTKVIRAFRDVETLNQFADGWLIYYNYFKPHQSLNGKTPAEEAKINYSVKNWADLARVPVSKESEIQSHKTPNIKLPKIKLDLSNAFKRKRNPQPRGDTHLHKGWQKERSLNRNPLKWTIQHYSKRGGGLTRRRDR
jgi:putative transposase